MAARAAERLFPLDEASADGHFPGNPIIPGATLLREVLRVVSADRTAVCHEVRSARFVHPVRPGDRIEIVWEDRDNGDVAFTCRMGTPQHAVLTGTLRMLAR